mmetsp:Transcript_8801/g.23078  ORF Transcript_8801/g.23078 Transcript_8801/m.23078 type:complete len:156 (-) Transcript_8801:81-548(-)
MEVNGVFDVTVVSAYGTQKGGKVDQSDPYCKVSVKDLELFRTEVVKNSLSPIWNCRKQVHIEGSAVSDSEMITFDVYDHDRLSRDDFLGRVELSIAAIARGEEVEKVHMLKGRSLPRKDAVTGALTVEVRFTQGPPTDSCTNWHFENGKFRPGSA